MKITKIKEVYHIEQDANNKIEITITKNGDWEIFRECVKNESFFEKAKEALKTELAKPTKTSPIFVTSTTVDISENDLLNG